MTTSAKPVQKRRILASAEQIRKALNISAEQYAGSTFQIYGQDEIYSTQFADQPELDEKSDTFLLNSLPDPAYTQFTETLEKEPHPEVMLIVFHSSQYLLALRTRFVELTQNGSLRFEIPERAFILQRRKEPRLSIPGGYEVMISLPSMEDKKKRIKKRLYDLSSSGLSFLVLSHREAGFYRAGVELKAAVFFIQGQRIQADLKIQNQAPLAKRQKGLEGIKIGVRFTNISPQLQEYLADYVQAKTTHLQVTQLWDMGED